MSLFFPSLSFWSWIGLFSSAYFIGMAKGGIKGTALLAIPIMAIIFGGKVAGSLDYAANGFLRYFSSFWLIRFITSSIFE